MCASLLASVYNTVIFRSRRYGGCVLHGSGGLIEPTFCLARRSTPRLSLALSRVGRIFFSRRFVLLFLLPTANLSPESRASLSLPLLTCLARSLLMFPGSCSSFYAYFSLSKEPPKEFPSRNALYRHCSFAYARISRLRIFYTFDSTFTRFRIRTASQGTSPRTNPKNRFFRLPITAPESPALVRDSRQVF